ncbi:ribonuclease HII [Patescibacteria group bacterium]|nr:ribonuclease HII [Patescibacteria group bacterium]
MKYPNFREEKKLWRKGYRYVVGLDEAGRGPLSGPVTAAAVTVQQFSIFNFQFLKIKDSKKLTPKKREEFYKILTNHPQIKWGIGRVSEKVIDKINIKNAAELAMEKALKKLKVKSSKLKVDFLIIDGIHIKNLNLKSYNFKLIPKADEKVFSCAAASIIAKVWRDRIMRRYHKKYLQYGFDKHKGYPTKQHRKMLKKYGPCKIHRKTFKPVKSCKNKDYLLS